MRRVIQSTVGGMLVTAALFACASVEAADLYTGGVWSSLASDRQAASVGDSLTVIIDENSVASGSANNTGKRSSHLGGQIAADHAFNHSGSLDLTSGFDGSGQTGRVQKMAAQISVVVDRVLPNGDLHVSGAQTLKINGERTNLRLEGVVRRADIQGDNTVLSTRIAEAHIDYDGAGVLAAGSRPGLLTRFFNWLGVP